ncbi:hypothetical protein F5Y16DRAFT_404720 [Xylariaceae sp. FL0255]|nr:hypothetical protein F5Y16DRAFT_404720 [Xylariaceae sp. FL0255]
MGKGAAENVGQPSLKRQRTDSGFFGDQSRSNSTSLKHHDSQLSSGTARSPIPLSDEPDLIVTEELRPTLREPIIVVHVGSVRQQIAQSKFLSHIWKSGLESPCVVCHPDFSEKDPPIRTLTFETAEDLNDDSQDITQQPIAPHPIRILNRHFTCLKAKKISYYPISHVWHQTVSLAQVARDPTLDAARLAYQIPVKTLLSLTKKFGQVEIWHDYLSVPQWQPTVQQQLLLKLPSIYSYPDCMVMHLDDVSLLYLHAVIDPPGYGVFIESIAKLTNSRYFDRMWVVLEYIQGRNALVLSQFYDILDSPAANLSHLAGVSLGRYVSRLGQDRFNELAGAKGFQWDKRACWNDQQIWKDQDPDLRTLGAAIFIIAQKRCRDHHDYFFSLRFLLNLQRDDANVHTILSDNTFASHLELCWDALITGDYSPLLFLPVLSEVIDGRAPWLRGHSKLSHNLWDYGTCRRLAKCRVIIREGKIQPQLESIGMVQSFEHYDFFGSAESVFYKVAKKILDVSGNSSGWFCDAISRIFPSATRKGQITAGSVDEWRLLADSYMILKQVERLGYFYFKGDQRSEAAQVSKKLMALLGLALPEKQSSISRIKAASEEAQWYRMKLDGLVSVKCKGCSEEFLFRAIMWDTSALATAEMYRIPGLLYDDTIAEGVGLIVNNGKIIGKMAYAIPACDCRLSEIVEIKSQSPANVSGGIHLECGKDVDIE